MGVKVLGILAMVDDGETDWKVIVIDINDPLADKMSNMDDVDREMPGFKEATREWFRIYKMPDGKPENVFGFDGAYKDPEFATKVIEETHEFWLKLVGVEQPSIDPGALCTSTATVDGSTRVSREEASRILAETPPITEGPETESIVDKWYYAQCTPCQIKCVDIKKNANKHVCLQKK